MREFIAPLYSMKLKRNYFHGKSLLRSINVNKHNKKERCPISMNITNYQPNGISRIYVQRLKML